MRAVAEGIGPRPLPQAVPVSLAVAFLLIFFLSALAIPAHAADDSNAGQLSQVPTVNAQQLGSALTTLSQGTNDTQIQQLLSQFQGEMNAGNLTGAASTLVELQGLSANNPSVPPNLNALIQSLSVGSGGATVDAGKLASLLNSNPGTGSGLSGESQQKLSLDMQSLASLMQYANSTIASEFLQNSSLLSQSAFTGAGGKLAGSQVTLPGVNGFSGLVPSVGGQSLSVRTPSAGIPNIPLSFFAVPLIAAAALGALYFSRGKMTRLVGIQKLPGLVVLDRGHSDEGEGIPRDPRGMIEFYFGRAVNVMSRRGVAKRASETHREFSSKCEGTPERPHISVISTLYEKAKFSGERVGVADASLAAASVTAIEDAHEETRPG